jgi:hypothetical protein
LGAVLPPRSGSALSLKVPLRKRSAAPKIGRKPGAALSRWYIRIGFGALNANIKGSFLDAFEIQSVNRQTERKCSRPGLNAGSFGTAEER